MEHIRGPCRLLESICYQKRQKSSWKISRGVVDGELSSKKMAHVLFYEHKHPGKRQNDDESCENYHVSRVVLVK